jgi:phosphoribosylanthranilate isomerase
MPIEVKICGLSTAETLEGAIIAGADFVGLVFFPASPRHVDLISARDLAEQARGRAKVVALVVDASDQLIQNIADHVRPDYFQAHGHEDPERVRAISHITGIPVIKAIKVLDAPDVLLARDFREAADMILFDAKSPAEIANALPGGNGLAFDWRLLQDVRIDRPWLLSGGLSADNLAAAVTLCRPPAVDISSGVERRPGRKDPAKIRQFLALAHTLAAPEPATGRIA